MSGDRALLAHLYRRAGFGATDHELDLVTKLGWDGAVERLIGGLGRPDESVPPTPPPTFLPFPQDSQGNNPAHSGELLALTNWWIDLMASTTTPLKEKLVLLLHSQFPTAYSKVNVPSLLYRQNALFRQSGRGRFDALTTAITKNPAMLLWLDASSNRSSHPNENFARELFERFTMGVGTYTQTDVTEAARAFTGWSLDYQSGDFLFNSAEHDFGSKQVLGHAGTLSGEQVIEITTQTKASAHWVVSRFWSWLAYPATPSDPMVRKIAGDYRSHLHLGTLLRTIISEPAFVSDRSLHGLLKQPIEYVVGVLRVFGLRTSSFPAGYVAGVLTQLGQQLFNPPTVGGWGANDYWLSTSNSLNQLKFAATVAGLADLTPVVGVSPSRRLQTLANTLGVDQWTPGTAAALKNVLDTPQSLVTLALVSPEYQSN